MPVDAEMAAAATDVPPSSRPPHTTEENDSESSSRDSSSSIPSISATIKEELSGSDKFSAEADRPSPVVVLSPKDTPVSAGAPVDADADGVTAPLLPVRNLSPPSSSPPAFPLSPPPPIEDETKELESSQGDGHAPCTIRVKEEQGHGGDTIDQDEEEEGERRKEEEQEQSEGGEQQFPSPPQTDVPTPITEDGSYPSQGKPPQPQHLEHSHQYQEDHRQYPRGDPSPHPTYRGGPPPPYYHHQQQGPPGVGGNFLPQQQPVTPPHQPGEAPPHHRNGERRPSYGSQPYGGDSAIPPHAPHMSQRGPDGGSFVPYSRSHGGSEDRGGATGEDVGGRSGAPPPQALQRGYPHSHSSDGRDGNRYSSEHHQGGRQHDHRGPRPEEEEHRRNGQPDRPMPNVSRSGSDSEHSSSGTGTGGRGAMELDSAPKDSSSSSHPKSSDRSPRHIHQDDPPTSSKSSRADKSVYREDESVGGSNRSSGPSTHDKTENGRADEDADGSNSYSLADFEPPRAEPIEHHHRFRPAYDNPQPPPPAPAPNPHSQSGSSQHHSSQLSEPPPHAYVMRGTRRRRLDDIDEEEAAGTEYSPDSSDTAGGGKRQRILSDLSDGGTGAMSAPYSSSRRSSEDQRRDSSRRDKDRQRHSYAYDRGRSRSPGPPPSHHHYSQRAGGPGPSGPHPMDPPPGYNQGAPPPQQQYSQQYSQQYPPHPHPNPPPGSAYSRGGGAFAPLPTLQTLQSYDSQILHSWSSQGSSSGGRQSPTDIRVCYDSFSRQQAAQAAAAQQAQYMRSVGSGAIGQVPSATMTQSRTWDEGPGGSGGGGGGSQGAPPPPTSQGPPHTPSSSSRYQPRYDDRYQKSGSRRNSGQGQPHQGQDQGERGHGYRSSSSRRPPPVDTGYGVYEGYDGRPKSGRSSDGMPPTTPAGQDYHRQQYPGYGPPATSASSQSSSSSSKDRSRPLKSGGEPSQYVLQGGVERASSFSSPSHQRSSGGTGRSRDRGGRGGGHYSGGGEQHYPQRRDDVDLPSPSRGHHSGGYYEGRGHPTPHGWRGGSSSYPPPPPSQHYAPRSGDQSPRGPPPPGQMGHPSTPQHAYSPRQGGGYGGSSVHQSRYGGYDDSKREPSPPSDDPLSPHPYHSAPSYHSSGGHSHHSHRSHRSDPSFSGPPPPQTSLHHHPGGPPPPVPPSTGAGPASMITTATSIAGLRTPSGVLLLAQPDDRISLSETLCVVRENVEVFTATETDVKAPAPGRKRPVIIGQVGLRCIHCRSETKPGAKVKRAVCFPSSIKRIYRTVIDMKLDHFKACRYVPDALKCKLAELKANNARSTGTTMQYFVQAAKKMGMCDGPNGVRYDPALAAAVAAESAGSGSGGGGHPGGGNLSTISSHSHSEFGGGSTGGGRPINLSHSEGSSSGGPVPVAGARRRGIANAPIGSVPSSLSMDSSGNEDSSARSKSDKDNIFKRKQGDPPKPGEADGKVIKADPESKFYHGKVLLSIPEDKSALSPLRCFLRENVYAFSATPEDIAVRTPTTFSVILGQVGIGCVHCYKLPAKERSNRAVCFPFSISRIYQSVADIQRFHLAECRMVPDNARKEFAALQSASSKGSKGLATRQYWVTSAQKLGLVDTERGIRFARDPSEPIAPALSLDILARVASDVTTASKPLVFDEDRPHIAEFLFHVMEQLQPCRFTEADRNKRRMKDLGCVGVECRHCAGSVESRKFFWSSVNAVESNFVSVHTHMMECKMVPQETKDELARLKLLRKEQTARLKTGSQKAFFAKVWERLHAEDKNKKGDQEKDGDSVGNEGTPTATPNGSSKGSSKKGGSGTNSSGSKTKTKSTGPRGTPPPRGTTPVTPERRSKEDKHHLRNHPHYPYPHHPHPSYPHHQGGGHYDGSHHQGGHYDSGNYDHHHHYSGGGSSRHQPQVHFQRPPPSSSSHQSYGHSYHDAYQQQHPHYRSDDRDRHPGDQSSSYPPHPHPRPTHREEQQEQKRDDDDSDKSSTESVRKEGDLSSPVIAV